MTEWIDLAIENWARWHAQSMKWYRRHCLSIEHRWRSPQPWDAPPLTGLGKVNELAAIAVEDEWKNLPFVPKMVLKYWYVSRYSINNICKSLRKKGFPVEPRYWDLELERAKRMLAERLVRKTDYTNNLTNASVAGSEALMGGFGTSVPDGRPETRTNPQPA